MSGQGFEQLTLFPAGSPASHLVLPGSDEARKMTATSGRKCCELCKSSSPLGSLVRTLLASSIWGSTKRYLIWKPQATKHGRLYFQLVPLTPPTDVTGAQLWATPNTMDYMPQRSPEALKRQAETTRKGRTRPANLREQVCEETVKLWPTPRANDAEKRGNISQDPRNGLPGAVLWTTPKATDYKGSGPRGSKAAEHDLARGNLKGVVMYRDHGDVGQLNPDWVEWLMAFPPGWTDIG